jgi:uncharacterized membrane protein YebE (DUF533 family)
MFNARDLLGDLLQNGMSRSGSHRVGHAMGPNGLGRSDNPLGQLLQGLGGSGSGTGGGTGGGLAGGLGGLAEMARGIFGGGGQSGGGGNQLAMGGLAALAGAFLGGRRGGMKGAVGAGALALLGSLAMSALKKQGQGQAQTPASTDDLAREAPLGLREPQNPSEEQELEQRAALIVRAMISAAKADGQIDGSEIARITGKLQEAGTDQEARDFVTEEMRKPLDLDGLVREVPNQEVAIEVYGASLLAIEVDTPAEQAYLRDLAQRLKLNPAAVQHVHQALDVQAAA